MKYQAMNERVVLRIEQSKGLNESYLKLYLQKLQNMHYCNNLKYAFCGSVIFDHLKYRF